MAKCPSCTAENPEGATVCEYCGAAMTAGGSPPEPERKGEATPGVEKTAAEGIRSYQCDSCGAVVNYSASEKALHCAYCGSNYVVDVPTRTDREQPKRIVPFGVERPKAKELFRQWLGKGFWRPGDLKNRAMVGDMLGVYLPFWAFEVEVESDWSASAGYHYTETETYKDSKGQTQTRTVTRTRWEPANGEHRFHYEDWLVSASGGLEQEWVSRIVPFDLDQAKPYAPDFLAGWAAEDYSLESDQARSVAETEIRQKETEKCGDMVPGDTYKDLQVSSSFSSWINELIVLPIWISSYRYKDKVYRFLVNGQTGEVVGNAPVSKLKVALAILIGVGIAAGIGIYFALKQ